MTQTRLPKQVHSYSEVPQGMSHVYEDDPDTGGYRLSAGGMLLRRVQEGLAAGESQPVPTTRTRVTRADWFATIGVARPQERKHLLAAVGRGAIKVER